MRNICIYIILMLLSSGCAVLKTDITPVVKIRYLDEYVIPDDVMVEGTLVGGLSDLDYDGEYFYAVCDLPSSPRIYQFSMDLDGNRIDTIQFLKVIPIDNTSSENSGLFFDSEGLLYHLGEDRFILSSEGSVKNAKAPFVAELDSKGKVLDLFKLPEYFLPSDKEGPRNNGVFEGLSHSKDQKGIWIVNELPLKQDGSAPGIFNSDSAVRFTYLDKKTKVAERQFSYSLDRLRKIPLLPYGINGVTAILEYQRDQFLVMERGFSAGYGSHGFRVLLYLADARNADSTLEIERLKKKDLDLTHAHKELIFDFNSIRKKLSRRSVDNLEGMAFGPRLPNGNRTLILISDNNFNRVMKQMNQVILMEVLE